MLNKAPKNRSRENQQWCLKLGDVLNRSGRVQMGGRGLLGERRSNRGLQVIEMNVFGALGVPGKPYS